MANLRDEIRQFCAEHNLRLNTDLGQHFLVDRSVLDAIMEAAKILPGDRIVEIGPGIGILTKELLEQGAHVTAIELDERMIPLLQKYVHHHLQATSYLLEALHQNALAATMPREPYSIVANIPYHITSPLLRHVYLESAGSTPLSMTLLIQKEVADRICDTENAGLLTVIVGLFGSARKIIDVPPAAFLPPPKVDSAVIRIESYPEPIADAQTIDEVIKLCKIAFAQKRKMLRNSFATFHGGLELLSAAAIDEKRRPQTLSVHEWIALAKVRMQA